MFYSAQKKKLAAFLLLAFLDKLPSLLFFMSVAIKYISSVENHDVREDGFPIYQTAYIFSYFCVCLPRICKGSKYRELKVYKNNEPNTVCCIANIVML